MTEIRIYEEHNKIVITGETGKMYDKIFQIAADSNIEEQWHDSEWTYLRGDLDKFMEVLLKTIKSD